MQPELNFDEIRPYRDEEVASVMQRLVKDPIFDEVLLTLYKSKEAVHQIKESLLQTTNIHEFQDKFMLPYLNGIAENSTKGLTISGLENLERDKSYLFISNHRDIILDAAFLNIEMHKSGINTTEIAIGSNLLIYPWITDLVKLNRAFVVKRNIPVKQQLEASKNMSHYIRHTITQSGDSIWIAQREGRTKNGDDKTQVALLKMFQMSGSKDFVESFKELNIVPLAISYEIEPCGNEKVAELLEREKNPDFKKSSKDDLWSMVSGLKNQKGRVRFQFGNPISGEKLSELAASGKRNEAFKNLAEYIDKRIYKNYKLWPNNYIAYDTYYKTDKYAGQYTQEEKECFLQLTHERLQLVNADRNEAMDLWLKMYAMPVFNYEQSIAETN